MTPQAPLNALRAFEAAVRTGSFTNAARELGVSSAAVSQQVKLLEDFWSETLFIRQGNRLALTDAGQTAYPQVAEAMTSLQTLSQRMQRTERQRRRLTLSAPQSVAETWLAPRLATLDMQAMKRQLDIRVDNDPVDLVRDRIDMRIFYGHDLYGDYRIDTLFSDRLVAVAAPGFTARHGAELSAIDEAFFIHTDWGRGFSSYPNWNLVLADRIVDRGAGLQVETSSLSLSFARQGFGVALAPARMADEDLRTGHLVELPMPEVRMPSDYLVAYPKRLASDPLVRSLVRALSA
ncbi:LysR substrate-binding domain-containing protein [Pseudooceanicola sp. C21-150M6]|uniref:LysR substrate-binding domain-containing protein n=1 Tax=Pseudooceanicola sp. C21-150M6 TaxID=3434355 RepID=UPI003D7FE981